MTIEETGAVMDILFVSYPQFYKNQTEREKMTAAMLWAEMFREDRLDIVIAAVKALIASDAKGFPPVIGAVKEKITMLTKPQEMTEAEAWAYVARAIRNSSYHAAEEFEKLPDICKRLVGSSNQLREWAITQDLNMEVISSNFMRSYKVRQKNERDYAALPESVKAVMLEAAKTLQLEEGDKKYA